MSLRMGRTVRLGIVGKWAGFVWTGWLLVAITSCGPGVPAAPNLILVSIDTLRADALGEFGAAPGASPALDSFFAESTLFTRAYSHEPHTLPSHVSLFTSLYPASHGVRGRLSGGIALAKDIPTLASLLQGAGYATAGFVNGGFLAERFGVARGFDSYDYVSDIRRRRLGPESSAGSHHGRNASETNRAALGWIDELRVTRGDGPGDGKEQRPFFLFIHYFDVHSGVDALPYDSPPAYRDPEMPSGALEWSDSLGTGSKALAALNDRHERLSALDRRVLRDLYQAALRYTDDRFGELIDGLDERGLLDESIVVLISDHGEEFQEHGRLLHTQIYEECLHVPLAFRLPGAPPETRGRRREIVGLVDVLPTLLELLGKTPPPGLQGRSLAPLISLAAAGTRPRDFQPKPLYAQSSTRPRVSMRDDQFKLILDLSKQRAELYDLDDDPDEEHDLAAQQPQIRRRLVAHLRRWQKELPRRYSDGSADVIRLSDEVVQQIRALGYGEIEDVSAGGGG